MNWRAIRIKELKRDIAEMTDWLVERAKFTKKLEDWLQKDKDAMAKLKEELQNR